MPRPRAVRISHDLTLLVHRPDPDEATVVEDVDDLLHAELVGDDLVRVRVRIRVRLRVRARVGVRVRVRARVGVRVLL